MSDDLLEEFLVAGGASRQNQYLVDFTVDKYVIQPLLSSAYHAIPVIDVKPVLTNFQVWAIEGGLRIVSSDESFTTVLETSMVEVCQPGLVLLPARELTDIVKLCTGKLTISVTREKMIVRSGKATWEQPLIRTSKYPATPSLANASVESVNREGLLTALASVKYAVGKDITQPSLMQVSISKGKVTASDGSRFQQTRLNAELDLKLPATSLPHVLRILNTTSLEEVTIAKTDNKFAILSGRDQFWFKTASAKFADVELFLLKPWLANNKELVVNKKDILDAIRHVRVNAVDSGSAIGLFLSKDGIVVSAKEDNGAKASEFVEARWSQKQRVVVVNHKYLSEMLAMYPEEQCVFLLGDDSGRSIRSPLLLRHDPTGFVGMIQQMSAGRAVYSSL